MLVWYALLTIFLIMLATYIGLVMSVKIENSVVYILFWVIYLLVLLTVLNGAMVANFWGTIQNKTGPPGPRGLIGNRGDKGYKGQCADSCRGKEAVFAIRTAIIDELNKLDKRTEHNALIESDLKNDVIIDKINQMAQSREFELGAEYKGADNLTNYLTDIWRQWTRLIYDAGGVAFFSDKSAEDNYSWKGDNPFDEMARYDVYHFGINKEFIPAKVEICNKPQDTNYLPERTKPRLHTIQGNYYKWIFYDIKRNDKAHISIWRPSEYNTGDFNHEKERHYPLGDVVYIYRGHNTENIPDEIFDNENGPINRQIGINKFKIPKPPDVIPKFEFFSGYDYKGSRLALRAYDSTVHFANHNFYRAIASVKIPDTMTLRRDKGYENIKMKDVSVTLSGYMEEYRQYLTLRHDENDLGNKRYVFIRWKWGIDGMKDDQEWEYKSDIAYLRSCSYKGNDGGPAKNYLLVSGDVKSPIDYELVYTDNNSCQEPMTIWRPIPPKGYVSMGFLCRNDTQKPPIGAKAPIRCLPRKCLYKVHTTPTILWTSPAQPSKPKVIIYGYPASAEHNSVGNDKNAHLTTLVAYENETIPPMYYINQHCLNEEDTTDAKVLEKENTDLGIGWHGNPTREAKYSIFSYLQMMPESIITNMHTSRKYYMIHSSIKNSYDTSDFQKVIAQNYYLVLKYNEKTRHYDRALAIDGTSGIKVMKASSADIRQLWIVEFIDDEGHFRLKAKETGKYLSHTSTDNLRGEPIETQVMNPPSTDKSAIFFDNKSAFGTSLDTMRNTKEHKGLIDASKDKTKEYDTSSREYHEGRTIKGVYNPQ
jgi:hypothetical protein